MITHDLIDEVPPAFSQLDPYETVTPSMALQGRIYTGPVETLPARTAIGALTGLVFAMERSREAAKLALSWRDYRVGACAVMVNFERGLLGYTSGFNVKPQTGKEGLNLHAEQIALAKGRRQNLNQALAIAVFANPDDDDANPLGTPTLRVCNRCVNMFEDAPEVDDELIILGANADLSVCELYTFGALKTGTPDHKLLYNEPFSLQTEEDLEVFDRVIKPPLTLDIYSLYGFGPLDY